jgi:hypothetical protein
MFNSLRARVCPHNARRQMGANIYKICKRGVSIQIMRRFAGIEMPNPGSITNLEFIDLVSFPETDVACHK